MPQKKLSKREIARNHVHRRILVQLAIFAVVTLVIFAVVVSDIIHTNTNFLWVIGALIVGLAVGLAVGRIFALKWHEDTQKVILSVDKSSILLVALYIIFRIGSEKLFGEFLHGEELTIVTFTILGGIMVGRVLGMMRSLTRVLKEQKIL